MENWFLGRYYTKDEKLSTHTGDVVSVHSGFSMDNLSSNILMSPKAFCYGTGHSNRRTSGVVKRKGFQGLGSERSVFKS